MVLEKLMKIDSIKHYPEDEDLLEDVIIENKQAIEMADIYSNILRDTTEAVASIINNNLNIVMKFLATVTLVISVPNIIFSAYGNERPQRGNAFRGQSLRVSDPLLRRPGSLPDPGTDHGEKEVFLGRASESLNERKGRNEIF